MKGEDRPARGGRCNSRHLRCSNDMTTDEGKATSLLLIDLQRDFLRRDGRLPVDQRRVQRLIETVNSSILAAQSAGIPIVQIQNSFPKRSVANIFRGFSAIEGSEGALPDERIIQSGVTVTKRHADAFSNPELQAFLASRGSRRLVVAGVHANGCVRATVKGALRRGYQVDILLSGVASASDKRTARALTALERLGASRVDTIDSAPDRL